MLFVRAGLGVLGPLVFLAFAMLLGHRGHGTRATESDDPLALLSFLGVPIAVGLVAVLGASFAGRRVAAGLAAALAVPVLDFTAAAVGLTFGYLLVWQPVMLLDVALAVLAVVVVVQRVRSSP